MKEDQPSATTAEDLRDQFMDDCRAKARFWAHAPNAGTTEERLMGLLHSILVTIDGQSGLPSFDLVARPHPDDKAYLQSQGEDWIEDGTVINADSLLHELLYRN